MGDIRLQQKQQQQQQQQNAGVVTWKEKTAAHASMRCIYTSRATGSPLFLPLHSKSNKIPQGKGAPAVAAERDIAET